MHPAVANFLINLTNSGVNIGMNMAQNAINAKIYNKVTDSEIQLIDKQSKILKKVPDKETQHNSILKSSNPPFVKVPNTNDINQLHAEKWNEYWNSIYSLSDNAGEGEVKTVMKNIKKDVEHYKCESCRQNAIAHLDQMEFEGDRFTDVTNKAGAVQKLCRFKNHINEMNQKPLFDCQSLVK